MENYKVINENFGQGKAWTSSALKLLYDLTH